MGHIVWINDFFPGKWPDDTTFQRNLKGKLEKGTLTTDQCTLLTNRCLSKLDNSSLKIFDDAIHLVNQWKHDITPTITYVNKLGTPVCKILPSYPSIMTTKVVNHCIKESNFLNLQL